MCCDTGGTRPRGVATTVLRRQLKGWKDAKRIVFGGGFSGSGVGELAIGRASVILKADKIKVEIIIIRNEPDEAGLLGAVHSAPAWIFHAHDAIVAVDIGGTNIRAGIVQLNLKRAANLSKAEVGKFGLWRHGDEKLEWGWDYATIIVAGLTCFMVEAIVVLAEISSKR